MAMETASATHEMQASHIMPKPPSTGPESAAPAPRLLPSTSRPENDAHPPMSSADVWSGAIARLQTQVSYNTSMLESNRRQVADVDQAIGRLQHEMGSVMASINDVRAELRARPPTERARHDPGDLDVLAGQVAIVTNKANEVDGLKMQVELLRNRMKRIERQDSPPMHRPGTSSATYREPHHFEGAPQAHHQLLPPMRTGSNAESPASRALGFHAPPVFPLHSHPAQTAEPLPPPPAGHDGRRHEVPPSTGLPPPPPPRPLGPPTFRPYIPEGEPEQQQQHPNTWAPVNHSYKRQLDESYRSPYNPSSIPASPKRPRLAPIVARGGHGEEGLAPGHANDSASILPSQGLPTPASANMLNKFAISTQEGESPELWRPDGESTPLSQVAPGRGRGRGRGGRGGQRRSRVKNSDQTPVVELSPADAQAWMGHYSLNEEHLDALNIPRSAGYIKRPDGVAGLPSGRESEVPATPISGLEDPSSQHVDGGSAGRKSRSKPFRNAEGILIRKDGRPDLRSVSSANNLRKVHAKKEAERDGDGQTSSSRPSLVPQVSNSLSQDGGVSQSRSPSPSGTSVSGGADEEHSTQERHQEFIHKMYPHGIDSAGGAQPGPPVLKTEHSGEEMVDAPAHVGAAAADQPEKAAEEDAQDAVHIEAASVKEAKLAMFRKLRDETYGSGEQV